MKYTPKWAKNLTADESSQPVSNLSDAERIAAARSRAMADTKENNAPGAQYGFEYPDYYYQDSTGPESSQWDAGVLVCFAQILEAPILKRSKYVWTHDLYDPRTGNFNLSDSPAVSIAELKASIDARIVDLGLSKVKIFEWFAYVREPRGQEYWRFDLETRVQKFRK